ncbi:hypothetical protein [Actinoplanes siamensis]|nr:hypothetical protein [Actinoplanes siamensis]
MNKWMIPPALALAAGLTGCGATAAGSAPAEQPGVHDSWVSCEQAEQDAQPVGLTGGFRPVSAVICAERDLPRAVGAPSPAPAERRVTDVTALVSALQLPDEQPTTGACTRILITPPWIALLDAQGRWIHVRVPVDQCRKPRAEVMTAVRKAGPR